MERIIQLINEAKANGTISRINSYDRTLISEEYKKMFGFNIDKFCNTCIFNSLIELYNNGYGAEGEKSVRPNSRGIYKKGNRK
jgi:hypothetical protein